MRIKQYADALAYWWRRLLPLAGVDGYAALGSVQLVVKPRLEVIY